MELGPEREGKACGVGCWILGAFVVVVVVVVVVVCAIDVLAARADWAETGARGPASSIMASSEQCRHRAAYSCCGRRLFGSWSSL